MDTKIVAGEYTLNIDHYCMWITEKIISKNGKERDARVTGYHRNLGNLLKDFIKNAKSSDCTTMVEVIQKIKEAEDQAIQIGEAYKVYKVDD